VWREGESKSEVRGTEERDREREIDREIMER
jgi:hypothetical protein